MTDDVGKSLRRHIKCECSDLSELARANSKFIRLGAVSQCLSASMIPAVRIISLYLSLSGCYETHPACRIHDLYSLAICFVIMSSILGSRDQNTGLSRRQHQHHSIASNSLVLCKVIRKNEVNMKVTRTIPLFDFVYLW